MKTWMDALGTCTAASGSVGGEPVPDSGASPDIPRPLRPCFLPTGCAGGIGPATCGQAPAYFATRRYLAAAACREWPRSGTHFSEPYFRSWPAAAGLTVVPVFDPKPPDRAPESGEQESAKLTRGRRCFGGISAAGGNHAGDESKLLGLAHAYEERTRLRKTPRFVLRPAELSPAESERPH